MRARWKRRKALCERGRNRNPAEMRVGRILRLRLILEIQRIERVHSDRAAFEGDDGRESRTRAGECRAGALDRELRALPGEIVR